MQRREAGEGSRFTIYHGFAASIAFHGLMALALAYYFLAPQPEDESSLVFELQGPVTDRQTEEKVAQETAGAPKQDQTAEVAPQAARASENPPPEDAGEAKRAAPTSSAKSTRATKPLGGSPGSQNVAGVEELQKAQTIKDREPDADDRIKIYVKRLTKKIQARLIYPEEGRQAKLKGSPAVSFDILPSGQIRQETLKLVESSGQPKLDAAALKTIRSCVPFSPPPAAMNLTIYVDYGRGIK